MELRIHRHRPNRVHLKDGTRLDEPPAVEGYLQRIRPNTQLKQSLYLVTHDGWMFATTPARAYPPTPPGAPLQTEDIEASPQDIEVCRGRRQIMHATGMTDLRSIVAVRRAFQIIPSSAEPVYRAKFDSEDTEEFWAPPESHEMDGLDPGGDEALYKSTDKASLRMRRSFELLLSSGRVIRFEVERHVSQLLHDSDLACYRHIPARMPWNGSIVCVLWSRIGENDIEWMPEKR